VPRDIPVGNGNLLIAFDADYQIRDLYFPFVGQENHAGWGPCRFGVWADGQLAWTSDEGWQKRLGYLKETLATDVALAHDGLAVDLECNDAVDFNRNVYLRKVRVTNRADHGREIRLFFQQDLSMYGAKVGDTAYYDPRLDAVVHYRGARYVLAGFCRTGAGGADRHGVEMFATGACGFRGAEGTWRDAEDGRLSANPISQGAVDSTIGIAMTLEAGAAGTFYYYLVVAESYEGIRELYHVLKERTPARMLERTIEYWRAWVNGPAYNFGNLPQTVQDLFKRSLLIIRTQIDNRGAVIAANDSDVLQFSRDTYSYMWPRDGALVSHALDLAGFPDITRRFYAQCRTLLTEEGYLLHKYNPDGTPASSWHPWMVDGKTRLPIQEDQTAVVLWALWRHFWLYKNVEYMRPLYYSLILVAADFMVDFRDPATGLPKPSYDLWEERYGVHTYTCATVYGGLVAARNFARVFGDADLAEKYDRSTIEELKEAVPIFEWVAGHALPSGVLAEQVDPYTNMPLSVSPLTWSHGTFALTLIKYLQKLEDLHRCPTCGRSIFRFDRGGRHQIRSHSWQQAHEVFETDEQTPDLVSVGTFNDSGRRVTLSVNTRDCLGCGVCLARCQPKVFEMCNDKSYINVRRLATCVLCRECVTYCPIGAIHVEIDTAADTAADTAEAHTEDAAEPHVEDADRQA